MLFLPFKAQSEESATIFPHISLSLCREPQPPLGPEAAMHPSPLYEWMGVALVTGNEAVVTARARSVG